MHAIVNSLKHNILEQRRKRYQLPDNFEVPIKGCAGVFHVAAPTYFDPKEPEEVVLKRAIDGTNGILKVCLNSRTVKRVVYTSSAAAVGFNDKNAQVMDESFWSDINYIKSLNPFARAFWVSKTLAEKKVLEFAVEHGLDLVTVVPAFVVGPFICPNLPASVEAALAMIFGKYLHNNFFSALSGSLKGIEGIKDPLISSKKLIDSGFKFKYGLDEIFDGAIQSCKAISSFIIT
ncbi:cinnamoyl-CoA reductase, putative [Ricinus communis]|uniref:Cinnamoyl-CoA reductase, putative n=1 Tax=Ricinus communis TaxID=3988 RepID=B9RDC9_RICCO|nr:cinnamoyl-CoA reductase, putative [Ricinus communis]